MSDWSKLEGTINRLQRYLDALEAQRERSREMQRLAKLAKTDPEEAQRKMRNLDKQPRVVDAGNYETAIKDAVLWLNWLRMRYDEAMENQKDLEASLDLQWNAAMRAIKMWHEKYPDKQLTWPDAAKLMLWLMEQIEYPESARAKEK